MLSTVLITLALAAPMQECKSKTTLTNHQEALPTIVETAIAGGFDTLVAAVKAAGLVETLSGEGPFTVFAPTNEAFAKIPAKDLKALLADKKALQGVLTYHVVPGRMPAKKVLGTQWLETAQGQSLNVNMMNEKPGIDGARIVKTDIQCSNGIIHVIDTVVTPRKDIVDTAIGAGSFNTLVAAVKAAGLVETLKSKGPFTVFAPTDAAFAAIPAADLQALLKDKAKLTAILTYHVVPGRILSTDLEMTPKPVRVASVQGSKVSVMKSAKGVTIDGAKVVSADLIVGNGVIHVIDRVILPGATGTPE